MSKQAVIKVLNEVRRSELTAISQYMAHHYSLNHLGYPKLAAESKKESFDEMQHAGLLAERILDLDGDPDFKPLKAPQKNGTVEQMIKADIDLEDEAIKRLNKGIKACIDNGDASSRQLLEQITQDEEAHLYALKQHSDHIKTFGKEYLLKFAEIAGAGPSPDANAGA